MCVCGGGGAQLTYNHILLQLGYGGVAIRSSVGVLGRAHYLTSTNISTSQRVYGKLSHYIHASLLVPTVPQNKALHRGLAPPMDVR